MNTSNVINGIKNMFKNEQEEKVVEEVIKTEEVKSGEVKPEAQEVKTEEIQDNKVTGLTTDILAINDPKPIDTQKPVKVKRVAKKPITYPHVTRNDYCICNSGKKFKICCWEKEEAKRIEAEKKQEEEKKKEETKNG